MTHRLTIADCRSAGFCIRNGVKPKCEQLGLDFRQLVKEGLPVTEELRAIDDAHLQRVLSVSDARVAKQKAGE